MLYVAVKNHKKKKQETNGLLSRIGLKTPLNKISIFGDILF